MYAYFPRFLAEAMPLQYQQAALALCMFGSTLLLQHLSAMLPAVLLNENYL